MKRYLFILSLITTVLSNQATMAQPAELDSIAKIAITTQDDSTKIGALLDLAWGLTWGNPDTAKALCEDALQIIHSLEKAGNQTNLDQYTLLIFKSRRLDRLGAIAKIQAEFSKAMKYYQHGLEIDEQIRVVVEDMANPKRMEHIQKSLASTYNNIGLIHSEEGNYPSALDYYFKGLTLGKAMEHKPSIAATLGNIGIIYFRMNDFPKALEFYDEAMKISIELNNIRFMATWNLCIGVIYEYQHDLDMALTYYLKAEQLAEEIDDKSRLAGIFTAKAALHRKQKEYKEALVDIGKALAIAREIDSKDDISSSFLLLARIYYEKEALEVAEAYLDSGLELATAVGSLPFMLEANEGLSSIFEETGRYKEAYEYYIASVALKDSIFNEDKSKELGKLEATYEFEKAEEERKRAAEEMRLAAEQEEGRRNNLQYSGILIFLVALVAVSLMLGKLSIPIRLAEGLIFFTFLLFFEFTLVLLDPYIETYSSGEPAWKLLFNAVLAAMIFPLHSFFEATIKRRLNLGGST